MSFTIIKRSLLLAILFLGQSIVSLSAATVPAGFTETVIPGPSAGNWNQAVGVSFESNGRMYVWERTGRVWFKDPADASFAQLLDLSEEVGAWGDHGLLGFALDPNFRVNGYVYLLYVVDRHHLMNFGTPSYNPNANDYDSATVGRLTRYTCRSSDEFRSVDTASRFVLIGETRQTGFPICSDTHGIGSLVFAPDGTLLVSCGDGASAFVADDGGALTGSFAPQAVADGILKTKEDIGAFRAQLVDSLSGKILRIDPVTGNGIASNPYYDAGSPRAARSRVWTLGVRNPCRMSLRPGTGSHIASEGNPGVLYIGEVGWNTWEALRVVSRPAQNCGWPLFEGLGLTSSTPGDSYNVDVANLDAPNPLYPASGCAQYFSFRQLLKADSLDPQAQPPFSNPCNSSQTIPASIPQFLHTRPVLAWNHTSATTLTPTYSPSGQAQTATVGAAGSPVSGAQFAGNCAIGGTWYTATAFPTQYQNSYFFADWGQGVMKNLTFTADDKPVALRDFLSNGGAIVSVAPHPSDGSMYYVSYTYGDAGTVRKLSYTGNRTPVAVASSDKQYGTSPLSVQFSSAGSSDPDGQVLTYAWNFGDGSPVSAQQNPSHTFSAPPGVPTKFTVTLTVTDTGGLSAQTTVNVSVNNTPPVVTIASPTDGALFSPTTPTPINLNAVVTDAQSGDSQLSYLWQIVLHHNDHNHVVGTQTNHTSAAVLSPIGCDGINLYYYRVILSVTDPAGLTTTSEVRAYPDCIPNLPPTISNVPDQSTSIGVPAGPITFTIGDAEVAAANLQLSAVSSNPALIPPSNIVFGGSGSNRTVTITPAASQTGTSIITLSVNDGPQTTSDSFVLTVTGVNTPPTISTIPNQTTTISTATAPIPFTVGDAQTPADSLVVSGSSGNPALVPNANLVFGGIGANRTLAITPVAGQSGTATITVAVSDGVATASNSFVLTVSGTSVGGTKSFTNTAVVTIPGVGIAAPYPSIINVAGMGGTISNMTVTLRNMTHTWPADVDMLLVGPGGQKAMIFSDVGGGSTMNNVTVTLSDTATLGMTASGQIGTGTYRPTNVEPGEQGELDSFSAPAPGGPYTAPLSVFNGQSPNGNWSLYVVDDGPGDQGSLAGGWSLTITTVSIGPAAPTISDVANQFTIIDTPTAAIPFTVGDADTAATSLSVSGSSANTTLVPNANIVFGGSGSNRTVTVTPAAGQTGTATITLTVSDGALTATDTFVVTVNAVNTAPTISNLGDQIINEDGTTGVLAFTVGDGEMPVGTLVVTGSSSNPTLVPNGSIVFGGSGANRTVTVTPLANQSGTATITLTVSDGQLSASDTFLLTVTAVNDVPTLSNIADQSTAVGVAVGPISFTVGDIETPAGSLTLSGSSGNTTLVPNANIVFGGSGANRTVTVTPTAGQVGTATITVTVSDGQGSASDTFVLAASNVAAGTKSFTNTAVVTIPGVGSATPYPSVINVSGMAGTISNMTVTLRNMSHTWPADVDILLVGPGGQKAMIFSDVGGGSSMNNVTVTLSDTAALGMTATGQIGTGTYRPNNVEPGEQGELDNFPAPAPGGPYTAPLSVFNGQSANGAWSLYAVDDGPGDQGSLAGGWSLTITTVAILPAGPTISDVGNQFTTIDTPTASIPFTVGDADTASTSLSVSGSSSNTTLVPNANIVFGGSGSNRTVTVTPAAGQTGTATITLTVSDGALAASDTFVLTVNAANTPPTISDIADRSINEDATTGAVTFTVGDGEIPVGSLSLTGSSSNPALVPNGNIVFGGSGANRTVTVTPLANQSGTATITVTVSDGQLSASDTFLLTVTAVNDVPTISNIPDQSTAVGVAVGPISFTIGDLETAPGSLTVSGSSGNTTLVPNANIAFGGSGANRTVTITPAAGQVGTAIVTVTVSDGLLNASDTLAINVNVPPTIAPIADQFVFVDQPTIIKLELTDPETAVTNLQLSLVTTDTNLIRPEDYMFRYFFVDGHRYLTMAGAFGQTGTATNTVTVSDGTSSASTTFRITVQPPPPGSARFANSSPITIPDGGAASPYPSVINVSGMSGTITNLDLNISRFFHEFTTDLHMLLVGPTGQAVVFLSQVGGGNLVTNVTFGVTDSAGFPFDPSFPIWSEVFRPTDLATTDFFPSPAPSGPYAKTFAAFNGLPANGVWSLYVYDDASPDHGMIAGGWSLMIATTGGTNQVPAISDIANQFTATSTPTAAIPFTVGDGETAAASLSLSGSSANTTLVPNANIVFGGSGSNRTVTVTPAAGQTGTATITVTVSDGTLSASDTFLLTVNSVNTTPTISNVADQTINEDTSTAALAFTVGDAESPVGSLNVAGGSSNPALVPSGNIVFGGSGANRTVTVTPLANQSGTATITVTVSDGQLSASDTFLLTVNAVNDTPTISNIADQSTGVGVTLGPISFSVGDLETPAGTLTVAGTSSNQGLVPNGNIVFGGSGANRTVTVTPASGQLGSTTITVTVSDGQASASDTFVLVVADTSVGTKSYTNTAVVTIPGVGSATPYPSVINVAGMGGTISNVSVVLRNMSHTWPADVDMLLVAPGGQKAMIFSDVGGGSSMNNVTVTLSDTAAVGMTATGQIGTGTYRPTNVEPGEQGELDSFPAPAPGGPYAAPLSVFNGQSPNGNWSLYVVDDGPGDQGSLAGGWSLTLTTVSSGPAAPTISDVINQFTTVSTPTAAIPFTVGDSDTAATSLTLSASSANTALVPNANIVFGGSGSNRTVTVTPATGQTGTATITLTVSDGALTASDTFLLTVNAVNTTPTISDIANQTINEDGATGALAFTVGDGETPVGSLTVSGGSSNPALVPNGNVVFGGSGANRTVTVTPLGNQSGTTTITVTVSDGQLTASDTFLLTVNAVNDTPTISNIADQSTGVGVTLGPISFTVGDVETPAGSLTVSVSSSDQGLVPDGNISFGGAGASRTLTLTPVAGQSGTALITVTVSDGVLTASDSFAVTASAAPPGLVAAYGFNEGSGTAVTDSSGNGLDGTINGATWIGAGKYGGALSFNGSTSYVDLGNPTSLQITGSMTWSAWVNAAGTPPDDGQIIAKSDDTSGWQFKTSPDTGPHTFGVGVAGGANAFAQRYSSTVRSLGVWYHVAGVYNATTRTLDIYVNGALNNGVLAGTVPAAQVNSAVNVNIGRRTGGYYFNGLIDEVRIYNRPLSAAEIQIDMNTPVGNGGLASTAVQRHSAMLEPPTVRIMSRDNNGVVNLRVDGVSARQYVIEASDDLVSWTPIGAVAGAESGALFTDVDAPGHNRRFYRVSESRN